MAFRTDYAKSAQFSDLFLLLTSFFLVFLVERLEFLACLQQLLVIALNEAGGKCDGLFIVAFFRHFLLGFKLRISAQDDVGTSSCHVCSYRDGSQTSRLCDYLSFLLMLLRIQHIEVLYPALSEGIGYKLRLFYRYCTYKYRLPLSVSLLHPVDDGLVLASFRSIYGILQVISDNRLVGRDDNNVHVVNVSEFPFLRLGGTRHSRKLLIHSEIVLQCDGRKRLGFRAHEHVFLSLDSLMESVAVSSSEHETSRELIYDHNLAVLYYIVDITLHHISGLQGL